MPNGHTVNGRGTSTAELVVIGVERQPHVSGYARYVKPAIDRLLGLLLLLLLLPVLTIIAIAVFVGLGRPVVFRQERVGRDGRPFGMYKFRTMHPDRRRSNLPFEGDDRRRTHKSDADPRHVPVGRFLRRWSLDELPQFVNVVRGEMSLVGPRPELVEIVERYEIWQHRRHLVKPGVTGLWQVTARETVMHENIELDLRYVQNVSLGTDVKILLRTLPAVVSGQRGR